MNNSGDATNLICISDLHINSTVALAPPSVNLDDGGTYHASRGQRWLWECWLDFIEKVKALDGRKVLLINGDMGELDTKRRSNQLITVNKATIIQIVLDTLEPITSAVDSLIVIRGTMAHTGKSQWLEESIARQYDHAIHDKACDNGSWYNFRGKIGGDKIDAAHHAPMGSLPWTGPNAANKLAALASWAYAVEYKQPLPDYLYRSHNHRYADSGDNFECKAIFLPCWSLITEYGYRTAHELSLAHIGGTINHKKVMYEARKDLKRVWALKI